MTTRPGHILRTIVRQLAECGVYSLLILLAVFLWMNTQLSLVAEAKFIQFFSILKTTAVNRVKVDEASISRHTWLIDAQSEGILVNLGGGLGNERIVNRTKIDTLLQLLQTYKNPERMVLCDLIFDVPQPADTALARTILRMPKIFWPDQPSEAAAILRNAVPASQSGYVDYHTIKGWGMFTDQLTRFPVQRQGRKSMALRMYESWSNNKAILHTGYWSINGEPKLNTVVVDESLRNYSLNDSISYIFPIQLAINLLKDHDAFADSLATRDFIVLGDFKNDLHETSLGPTPGALINFNLFLSLMKHENEPTAGWAFSVWLMLMLVIHFTLYWPDPEWYRLFKATYLRFTGLAIGSIISMGLLVSLISAISYLRFGVMLEIIPCATFAGILFFFRRSVLNYYLLRNRSDHVGWLRAIAFVFFHRSDVLDRYTI